jgi:iron(III) transport system ATP-binding protein
VATLSLAGLTKRFGSAAAVDALDLAVPDGALVALLGPSGCGKTTTLRLIAGFVDPDAGEIALGGRVISAPGRVVPPEHRNMAMIFQSYALWPHMTVAENVGYGLSLRKLPRADVAERTRRMLATVRLDGLADRYPAELSGGQQQRVALARALVVEPETLLLDEPLSNLDASLREEMRYEIRRLHDAFRTTAVYVTHDQAEAMTAADIIVVMNHGRIEQAGPPEALFNAPESTFVARFLGGTNIFEGTHVGGGVMELAGFRLRAGSGAAPVGARAAVSIRAHQIALAEAGQAGENVLPARVLRATFLGASRDMLAALGPAGDAAPQVRVTLPPAANVVVGAEIALSLPPEHCRALSR